MRSACAGSLTGIRHIDWAADSAFRFFPIERDPLLGWRLHLFDAATNKALTLAAHTETGDYVDIIEFHKTFPLNLVSSRSEEHTPELQSQSNLVCRLLLET